MYDGGAQQDWISDCGFLLDANHMVAPNFRHAESFGVGNLLENNSGAFALLFKSFNGAANVCFNNVIPENNADWLAVSKVLRQSERFRDSALAPPAHCSDLISLQANFTLPPT
jgi:hypothetical protein